MTEALTPRRIIDQTVENAFHATDVMECLRHISDGIEKLAEPAYSSWVMLDRRSRAFFNSYVHSKDSRYKGPHHKTVRKDGWSYRLVETGEDYYFPDARLEPSIHPAVIRQGISSVAMFSVVAHQTPIGALYLNHTKLHYFKKRSIQNVKALVQESAGRLIQLPLLTGGETDPEEAVILDGDLSRRERIFEEILSTGTVPHLARTVEEAYRLISARPPMAVFLDDRLQDGSGLELGSVIVRMCLDRDISIPTLILMAGETTPDLVKKAIPLGFLGVYPKSFFLGPGVKQLMRDIHLWHRSLKQFKSSDR